VRLRVSCIGLVQLQFVKQHRRQVDIADARVGLRTGDVQCAARKVEVTPP
jgi:hypothetical protein